MTFVEGIQIAGDIFSIVLGMISLILGAISLFAIFRQIRLQNRQLRASTSALLAAQLDQLNKTLLEYIQLDVSGPEAYASLTEHERTQCRLLYHLRFNLLEQTFLQYHQHRLLDQQDWQPWHRMIEHEFAKPQLRAYWSQVKHQYDTRFSHVVDSAIGRIIMLEGLIQQPIDVG